MRKINIKNEEETKAFGLDLAKNLKSNQVIALIGDLGTGKTTLTKYIAMGLGIEEMITSPTFTIVQEYHSGRLPLYHFDVYRINDVDEMFEIGAEEYFYGGGITIIEWAEKIDKILPEDTLRIYIDYGKKQGERIYKCTF